MCRQELALWDTYMAETYTYSRIHHIPVCGCTCLLTEAYACPTCMHILAVHMCSARVHIHVDPRTHLSAEAQIYSCPVSVMSGPKGVGPGRLPSSSLAEPRKLAPL